MSDKPWVEEFFSQWLPPDWINAVDGDAQQFRPFLPPKGKWVLGRSVGTSLRSSQDQIQVLWLFVQHQEAYIRKYVAKVFPDYTEKDAAIQLRRFPSPLPKKLKEVKDELDPFVNEARAYHRIEMSCKISERVYFPEFHGVITDLGISKYISGYINPRAIVLEAIRPRLVSRRILAARQENSCELQNQLHILGSLSDFEVEYYHSLFYDRIRRLSALHRLGITHGDVRDDHFRLPGDFYDTVLYDFSHSYTFSPVTPYLVNFRPPRSLKEISDNEQDRVKQLIYKRAEELDLRDYLVKSTGVVQSGVISALFQPLKDECLELIILRVKSRPDAFSMPSVNSVFPFLEAIRPKDDYTWHIRRGRLLEHYRSIWISSITDSSGQTTMSFVTGLDCAEHMGDAKARYLLCLVPKEWGVESICSSLMSICSSMPHENHGCIKTWLDFNNI